MVWKKVSNSDAGDSTHFGGDDVDKISETFNAGTQTDPINIKDENLLIVDPSDTAKKVRFDAGGITSSQTRVITLPDADITVASTTAASTSVAGLMSAADKTKLDAIEASATADQTNAQIVAAVEAGTDSNTFTDADHSKLNAIEALADVTDATNVDAAGALMLSDTTTAGLGIVIDEDAMGSNSATKVPTQQSVVAYVASQITAEDLDTAGDSGTGAIDLNSQSLTVSGGSGITTSASSQAITIAGDDASATAKGVVELATTAELNTGTDTTRAVTVAGIEASARSVKLDAIEALADVTDATNVDAAGALMLSDTTTAGLGIVIDEDTLSSDSDTKVPTQQSVKAYVDTEVASALSAEMSFKGDYNASTNSPDLDTSPSGVKKGDMYVVSTAGTFFTIVCEIGDVLVAKIDSATLEANWVVVQVNVVAASATVAGNVELATVAETDTGTDTTRALTPAGLAGSALKTKLDTIETSATADQTDAEIRTAVEAATDSNVFTDADHSKLNAIEASATADQTDAEIVAAVEAGTDSNTFTDADHSKLNAIEASADVTDATNVNAAGATMNTDTDISGNSWVLDEDNFTSDSATKVPTQQSVKAYVAANAGGKALLGADSTEVTITGTTSTQVKDFDFIKNSATLDVSTLTIAVRIKTSNGASTGNLRVRLNGSASDSLVLTTTSTSYEIKTGTISTSSLSAGRHTLEIFMDDGSGVTITHDMLEVWGE